MIWGYDFVNSFSNFLSNAASSVKRDETSYKSGIIKAQRRSNVVPCILIK
jgi:hypothetical protein